MSTASNNLIKEFCQSIGMDPLGFDDDNQRSLAFDEKIIVTFLGDDTDYVTALCFIAESDGKPVVMSKLLEQNFLAEAHGGARFAFEPKTTRVVMTRNWDAIKTTVPQFSDELEAFVNSGMQAQEFIANCGDAPVAKEEGQAAPIDSLSAAYQAI